MRPPGTSGPADRADPRDGDLAGLVRRHGGTALLVLAATRRAPAASLGLALLARARLTGVDATPEERAGREGLAGLVLAVAAARLLAPAVLVPLALVGSLVLLLGVVLVLAGVITALTAAAGLG